MSFRLPTFTDETNLVPSLRRLVSDLEGTLGEQGDRLEALENTSTAPGTGSPLEIQQETSVVDSDVSVMNFTSGGDVDLDVSYSGGVATINVSVNSAALQTELDGTSLNTQTSVINFKGNLDVYSSAGVINVSIPPASNTVQTEVEGSVISSDTSVINFRGNVDVYTSAGVINVSIPSGGGGSPLEIQQATSIVDSDVSVMNFTGGGDADVDVSQAGGVVTVNVSVNSGAGGSTPIRVHAILASVDFANNVTGAGALHPCRCSNVLVNDSTAWDTSVFTAPTTGLYQFNVYYAVQNNGPSSDWARIHFNCSADTTKSIQGPLNVRTNSNSQGGHYSTAIYLSVGQSISPYIQVFGGGGNNGDITAGQLGQATFSAFLVN